MGGVTYFLNPRLSLGTRGGKQTGLFPGLNSTVWSPRWGSDLGVLPFSVSVTLRKLFHP